MALKGITVIELAGIVPAPYCGMILSDFGAEVIRIDKPKGQVYPDNLARGKRSVILNLKKQEGVDVLKRLCKNADVLVEPFRPGVMEKLGLGPDVLTLENPGLIYARLTGYGQEGPLSQKAGHDINYIAISGVLDKLGRDGETPSHPINLMADFAGGGLMCAMGIIMALFERSRSGEGQVIDANMVDGAAYVGMWLNLMNKLFVHKKGHNILDGGSAFYGSYRTKDDKFMAVGAVEPQFYKDFVKGLGLDPTKITQRGDQKAQKKLFQEIFLTKTQNEWTEIFSQLDACVTPVLTSEQAATHAHNVQSGMFLQGAWEEDPEALHVAPAPKLSRTPGRNGSVQSLPKLGQHTLEVLAEKGFTQQEIADLVAQGSVCDKKQK